MRSCLVRSSGNILLAGLSTADQALLEPHAEPVSFACGRILIASNGALDAVFFPGTALLSIDATIAQGRRVEVALIGREGIIGWPALLGSPHAYHAAVMRLREGSLIRVALAPLRTACERSPSLWSALLRFVHLVMVQMAHAIAAQLDHRSIGGSRGGC